MTSASSEKNVNTYKIKISAEQTSIIDSTTKKNDMLVPQLDNLPRFM